MAEFSFARFATSLRVRNSPTTTTCTMAIPMIQRPVIAKRATAGERCLQTVSEPRPAKSAGNNGDLSDFLLSRFWRGGQGNRFMLGGSLLRRHLGTSAQGCIQKCLRPVLDTVSANDIAQQTHACALLLYRHNTGLVNGFGNSGQVVRIDNDRAMLQLRAGAGELADNHHAHFVNLRRTEFLGNEVHSIFQ